MTIRSPKYNSQGFTLVEMLVSLIIIGIIMGITVPSFLWLNKPLRTGALQFKAQLNLIRSKAIASNRAYRIRPKYPAFAQYTGQNYQGNAHNFIVEYAANCRVNTYGAGLPSNSTAPGYNAAFPNGTPDGWLAASQLDLDLPDSIGVTSPLATPPALPTFSAGNQSFTLANQTGTTASTPIEPNLNWSICYDNRGVASQNATLTLQDFQANNLATSAQIQVGAIGDIDITTIDRNAATIPPSSQGNPVF
ncbi:prepilin-type N-terminal cleavage/methylation domain-containing protein [Chamaesiphon sp. VAR_48_metabat_403]|uniref:pilus assembly FimT family protein n=1 Tax=Chamaesiphon sp. VAR_48_metabat_403 TaxID=2964700 RepID=UPI00286E85D0|nr:prepilin-type N-terminal cleavage/methylation domain-containing protein [Chamaesiphon sp. VAR_48_metabat_403]